MENLDERAWTTTGEPLFTVDEHGQLGWVAAYDGVMVTDHDTRSIPDGGRITLQHVWNRDRTRLTRLIVEGVYRADGPMFFAEARRPHRGWRGDELARLLLAVLTCGAVT